jgi:CRP-like cAMP-binding protein
MGMSQASVEQLAAVAIFAQLQPAQLASLQPHSRIQPFQTGEIVNHEGDRLPARLYALIQGSLRVSKLASSGKETILRTLSMGDIFAAPALFGNGIAPATVTAEAPSVVLMVDREALLTVIQAYPEIALHMMAVFNQRLQQLHETVHGLVSERALVRLARFIQEAAHRNGEVTEQPFCLRVSLSYYEIARSIGITYEECVRLFKQIQSAVAYSRGGKVTVLDWAKLAAIADGELDSGALTAASHKSSSLRSESNWRSRVSP